MPKVHAQNPSLPVAGAAREGFGRRHIVAILDTRQRVFRMGDKALVSSFALLCAACSTVGPPAPLLGTTSEDWEVIFDGETLDGWTPKISGQQLGEDEASFFQVVDGVLKVAYPPDARFERDFGHLFFERSLSAYSLAFEYRFVGDQVAEGPAWAFRNSGLMVHAQDPTSMGIDQSFPVSIEAQLLGSSASEPERPTANICTPGTHAVVDGTLMAKHCQRSTTIGPRLGEWQAFRIDVDAGQFVRLSIDGEEAFRADDLHLDLTDPEAKRLGRDDIAVDRGFIALQAESHPVEFRNIKLLDKSGHAGAP